MVLKGINPAFIANIEKRTKDRNDAVQSHEAAHAAAAGPYGGGIHIQFGSNELGQPLALGGHVPIKMPPMVDVFTPMKKIEQAQSHARTVAFAAIAPRDELSSADKAVYAQAMTALATADRAKSERKFLNILA